tara:strand:- start:1218 stop:1829 length:612 start_codon:yes stop_codon:yes gene_type:complete
MSDSLIIKEVDMTDNMLLSEDFKNKDKWEKHALIYYNSKIKYYDLYNSWDKLDHQTKIILCEDFYNTIFKNRAIITGYSTMEANNALAMLNITPTKDHFQVARIALRAMMKHNREILKNEDDFLNVCQTLAKVVEVTKEQNGEVKYSWRNKVIVITQLAIQKYNSYNWINEFGRKVEGGFPLNNEIYDWYTQFEKDNLNKVIA